MKRQKYVVLEEEEVSLPMQKISPKIEKTLEAQVQDGDTLASIALRFHCTVAEIKRLNKIDKDNEIYARKIIKVPITPHSILLETLPAGENNTLIFKDADEFFNNNDVVDSLREEAKKLNEKFYDSGTSVDSSQKTINAIVLNSRLRRNLYSDRQDEQDTSNSLADSFEDNLPQPRMIRGPTNVIFDCSGSDCDMSWICLFVLILALCFAIPLIYIVYIAEHYEKFHHNSTAL
ncbi:lysM and putative peptidoglycan-binding domain-containing protein 3 [Condylostylus longicornis]|uniref:lysM and putative peptidoglycan-binding domain-containing protein 3 n=1 Tax=Condylostylus longicornis TaxID=2530218 RepID=UPI00244DDF8B|nr:lysM and putative peptidoglycan-binding domain-containing protein 3 [Condylostylus longicornis]